LTIPDVRQRDDYSCGAACLAALLSFHGIRPARWVREIANPVQGTATDTVEAVLWRSLGCVARGTMTLHDLAHYVRTRRPVVCPISLTTGGHWVVVSGVTSRRVYYHCPLDGLEWMTRARWLACWRDWTPDGSEYPRFGLVGWPK
jgi:predicted double-glycine peptidase